MSLENQNTNSPEKEYDFSKGVVLKANTDMPLLGLKEGDTFEVMNDGLFLRREPFVASREQLIDQIEQGTWTLEKTL